MDKQKCVIGIDFGTDSVRALVVNTSTGEELGTAVQYYPRWRKGLFCDPAHNQFRQHPLDYIESLEAAVRGALASCPPGTAGQVVSIGVDTTGSTPVAVDRTGAPLAMTPAFAENPHAMFILWKDHTGVREAEEINTLARSWGGVDYTMYEGGIYSSEWFWAKILRTLRVDEKIRAAAYSWVEHCDWIPFLLTGGTDVHEMKRSRCAAGHKAMWHASFGGLPSEEFLAQLDPLLAGLRDRLYQETYTSDVSAGTLSAEWANRLGLSEDVTVAVGAFDAHMGAVGGEIEPYYLSKIVGTSTCDILVAPMNDQGEEHLVQGICGQVDGSVIPEMLGLEAGQSAFGDIYAWFRDLLSWPVRQIVGRSEHLDERMRAKLIDETMDRMIVELSAAAAREPIGAHGVLAVDWMNGRRTPDANQMLKGAITGLNLGSDAPKIFRALVEATCFGSKAIVDRFQAEGVPIHGIIALGGVAKKSPLVMQIMADVLDRPIKVAASEQTCALGAAMFAAVAAEAHPDVASAIDHMGSGFDSEYHPIAANVIEYRKVYEEYLRLGALIEQNTRSAAES